MPAQLFGTDWRSCTFRTQRHDNGYVAAVCDLQVALGDPFDLLPGLLLVRLLCGGLLRMLLLLV